MARPNHAEHKPLLGADAANFLDLDVTKLTPQEAAKAIVRWLVGVAKA